MTAIKFKKWDLILGWVIFTIALITYTLTIEPTVSSWDVGEYISTAIKLEVGHPPGAPLFQMLGAFFAMFTTDVTEIAKMVNFMSALSSAFTILFLFWTISNLGKKLALKSGALSDDKYIAILGSSIVGSLSYTFSDSFWFSAVEGEVYAMSSFLMALLFWLGLKWESEMQTPRGNKWLVLISFVVGLSFGVHILSLLVIPSIVMLYFFKTYKEINLKTTAIATIISVIVLMFVFKFLFPFTLKFFSASELFFINTIGMPYNFGTIIAGIALIVLFYFGLNWTRKKDKVALNTLILSLLFIMIGFSSWIMLPIRANANTTINENNPSSARELLAYYNREQYGDANVFYDTYYSNSYDRKQQTKEDASGNIVNVYKDDKPKYEKKNGEYIIVNKYENILPVYSDKHKGFIPRMVDPTPSVIERYKAIAGIPQESKRRPTFGENLTFMIDYQFGYMYGRYFMWNFVGRQNDIQGNLDINNGNWLSGIDAIDEARIGSQQKLPSYVLENKGRNTYYFLPLLLGLIGLFFLFNRDKKLFWTMLVFFLFTGIAIQVYTNVRPFEPRERDYSLVGSFYVFALWIGFGVFAIYEKLSSFSKTSLLAPIVSLVCLIAVPGILISQNWDDHDRSKRETAHAMAIQYLESCGPNAIIFTIGDNDTFPLWYAQEIEGVRRDVRVVCTSLFNVDWYIDQMKRKAYESAPIPSSLTHEQYKYGTRDYIIKEVVTEDTLSLNQFLGFITSDDARTKYKHVLQQQGYDTSGQRNQDLNANYLPTENVRIPVDKATVLRNGIVKAKDSSLIVPYIDIKIKGAALYKNRLMMLDIIANNNWERPIYFTGGAFGDEDYIWMKDYLQLDGLVYKLVPIKTPVEKNNPFDMGRIDTDKMYDMVTSWDWGNNGDPKMYHDVETRKNSLTYRGNLARLIEALIQEDKLERAEEVADLAMAKMPVDMFGFYTLLEPYIGAYYELEATDKARDLYMDVSRKYQESLSYYSDLSEQNQSKYIQAIYSDIERYRSLVDVTTFYESDDFIKTEMGKFNNYLRLFTGEPEDQSSEEEAFLESTDSSNEGS